MFAEGDIVKVKLKASPHYGQVGIIQGESFRRGWWEIRIGRMLWIVRTREIMKVQKSLYWVPQEDA
mgnify:FL=1